MHPYAAAASASASPSPAAAPAVAEHLPAAVLLRPLPSTDRYTQLPDLQQLFASPSSSSSSSQAASLFIPHVSPAIIASAAAAAVAGAATVEPSTPQQLLASLANAANGGDANALPASSILTQLRHTQLRHKQPKKRAAANLDDDESDDDAKPKKQKPAPASPTVVERNAPAATASPSHPERNAASAAPAVVERSTDTTTDAAARALIKKQNIAMRSDLECTCSFDCNSNSASAAPRVNLQQLLSTGALLLSQATGTDGHPRVVVHLTRLVSKLWEIFYGEAHAASSSAASAAAASAAASAHAVAAIEPPKARKDIRETQRDNMSPKIQSLLLDMTHNGLPNRALCMIFPRHTFACDPMKPGGRVHTTAYGITALAMRHIVLRHARYFRERPEIYHFLWNDLYAFMQQRQAQLDSGDAVAYPEN